MRTPKRAIQIAGLSWSILFTLVVSLVISGCGTKKAGTENPDQMGNSEGNASILPGLGASPHNTKAGTSTTTLTGVGIPSEANAGGINAPQGMNLNQLAGRFAASLKPFLAKVGSFDPRQIPEAAKAAHQNYMCEMKRANLFVIISGQTTLPEYIASLYVDILRRPAESREAIDQHAKVIQANGVRAGVRGFLLSDEHLNKVITAGYRYFFGPGRGPSQDELDGWRANLASHVDDPGGSVTLEQFYTQLIGSGEFYKEISDRRQRKYIIDLHRFLLNRNPPNELEIIKIWIEKGKFDFTSKTHREKAAKKIIESHEYRLNKLAVLGKVYFGEQATGEELAARLDGMKSGRDQIITVTDMLTDARYFTRSHALWATFTQAAQNRQCEE